MARSKNQIVIPVGQDVAVIGKVPLWLAGLVVLLMFVASTTASVVGLRLFARYTQQNSVHRARNEASHICIAEIFGEGRRLAKRNMDWSPKESLAFYEACVDRVAATLIPPDSVRERLRFGHPTDAPFAPSPTRTPNHASRSDVTASPRYSGAIYVPPQEAPTSGPSTAAPTPRRTSTPTPTQKPRSTPAPCDPACAPTPPPI